MKTDIQRRVRRKEQTPRTVNPEALVSALRKASIPARYIRPEVSLSAFPWGKRMKAWLDGPFFECAKRGKGMFLTTPPEDAMVGAAMLTRALVIRGHDAVFTTLSELIGKEQPRQSEFMVIAGFYDSTQQLPMDPKEAYRLSWMLWRMASEGTVFIVPVSGHHDLQRWWPVGALTNMLDPDENFKTK